MPNAQSQISIAVLGQKQVDRLTQSLDRNAASMERANATMNQAFGSDTRRRVDNVNKSVRRATKTQRNYGQQVAQTLEAFIRYNIVNQVFNRVTRGIRDSIQASRDLQSAVSEVQTIAGGVDFSPLRAQVRALSDELGIDQVEVANAAYQALSNQVGDAAESFDFVRQSAVLARGAFLDLSDAGNLLAGILNAYGDNARSVERLNDVIFRTIELGRITGPQLSKALGTVIGPAADLGIGVQELAVAFDQLTLAGIPVDRSATSIRAAIFSLLKPSDDLDAALRQIGAASIESAVAQRGLIGTIAALADTTGGLSSELAELFPNIRAFSGIPSLVEGGTKAMDEFSEGLDGVAENAEKIAEATEARELERSINRIQIIFSEQIGDRAVTAINDVIEALGGAGEVARGLATSLRIVGPPLGVITAGFVVKSITRFATSMTLAGSSAGSLTTRVRATAAAYNLSNRAAIRATQANIVFQRTLGVLSIAATAATLLDLAGAFDTGEESAEALTHQLEQARSELNQITAEEMKELRRETENEIDALRDLRSEVFETLNAINSGFLDSTRSVRRFNELITSDIQRQLSTRQSAVETFLNRLTSASEDVGENIRDALDVARSLDRAVNDARFQERLSRADSPQERANLLAERTRQFIAAAREAEAAGESEEANQLLRDGVNTANELLSVQGQTSRALRLQNEVLAASDKIAANRVETERQLADQAERQVGTVQQQLTEIEQLHDRLEDLQDQRIESDSFDTSAIDSQIEDVSGRLEELYNSVSENPLAERLLNRREVKQLASGFTSDLISSIEGQDVSLEVLLDAQVDQFHAELQARLDEEVPIEVRVAIRELTGVEFGPQGGAEQFNALRQQFEEQEALERLEDDRTQAERELANEFKALRQILETQFSPTDLVDRVRISSRAILRGGGQEAQTAEATEFAATRAEQIRPLVEAVAEGSVDALETALENFDPADTPVPAGAATQDLLTEAELRQIKTEFEQAIQAVRNQKGELDEVNREIDGTNESLRGFQQVIDSIEASRGGGSEGSDSQSRSSGGPIFRSSGGGIGTDTVPAMLSPREFVMNARATKKFHSQLVAMNAGQDPTIYRQSGGDVTTNVSVGDVVINNPPNAVNGRTIARDIRREIRRGTSEL